jgi:hypothetical protein
MGVQAYLSGAGTHNSKFIISTKPKSQINNHLGMARY